jgi:two-component system, cell cycle sensor histidine kinase and response regulator CckA
VVPLSAWGRRAAAVLLAAGIVGALTLSYFATRLPPIPRRPLRIGFEPNPPVQIRTDSGGFSGLAVEAIDEAAKRAGVRLQWVETGTSSDEAFQKGLVDLWPLMADLPERRKRLHMTQPWLRGNHVLLFPASSVPPGRKFTGGIAVFKMPLHVRLVGERFPEAQVVQLDKTKDILKSICRGSVSAAFLEARMAATALREQPAECASVDLRVQGLPDMIFQGTVGSTFEAAGAAEAIRREIGGMFRDGTLAVMMAKYSYYGLDSDWATYYLMQAAEHARWIAWGIGGLVIVIALALWRVSSLRQRKQAEAARREIEERFRAIFQQAAVGVAQVNLDGEVAMVNDRYCEVLGYTRDELLGTTLMDKTHQDDVQGVLANRRRLLAGESSAYSMEMRCVRKDRAIMWVKLYGSLVRDGEARPRYFIAVVEDITERRRAEAALRESEKYLKNAERLAQVGHWHWDLRDNRVSGSEEMFRIFGKPKNYVPSYEGFLQDLIPHDRERLEQLIRDSLARKIGHSIEYQIAHPNGELRTISCIWEVLLDEDGSPVRVFGTCQDITDSRRTQEEALARQKLESLGVLAGGIAHDFNNLLGGILAEAELVEQDLPADSSVGEEIERIKAVAIRGAEIVRELMIYAGHDQAHLVEPLDLSELVEDMLELLKVSISKHAVLKTDLDQNLPAVWGNAAQIRQVVMNLLINASEAIGEKQGVIEVTTKHVSGGKELAPNGVTDLPEGDYLRLEVSDTGCGMTDEAKAKVFDPFYTTKFAGRGLGLAVVQGIVHAHGGNIKMVSAPGQGTTFQVLLSCTPKRGLGTQSAITSFSAEQSNARAGTVLVVEDEELIRLAVSKALRRRGFSVMKASDGSAAMDLIRTHADDIDVILLDVTLPGRSSREVFEEAQRLRPDLRMILTSAYGKETVDATFAGLRIEHFIRKPFQLGDLVRLIGSTLSVVNEP